MPEEPLAPTIERTLRLVELLLAHPDGLTPQELLQRLDVSRSTLFVLLRALKTLDYVEQSEKRGRYRPGPRLQSWRGAAGPATQDLLTAFHQEATQQTWQETLALVKNSSEGLRVLAQVECVRQVRSVFIPGQVYPTLRAAQQVLAPHPNREVSVNGYSLVQTADSLDLALPVCRDGNRPEAALLLSAPLFRWQPAALLEACLEQMRTTAARLSYRLGAPCYTPYRDGGEPALQPTTPLSAGEIDAFLQGPWTARLACVRPDGRPHVIPVWQEWDNACFYLVAWRGSQWAEYLFANPNVSLTIDEPWPPLRRVVARGQARPVESHSNPAQVERLLTRLTRRYLSQPATPELTLQVAAIFCLQPETLRGWQGLTLGN